MLTPAPYFADVADGPEDGQAYWLNTRDGVRIRVGIWRTEASNGSVLLFPGRTEYIEKYGRTARDFQKRGFATMTIDWRGQGISDRLADDIMSGHVDFFRDYQNDVAAMTEAAGVLDLPKPWFLLGHSMGGCIGLRAIMNGLPVAACAFTGPMWGIRLSPLSRPCAWILSWASRKVGLDHLYAPGTVPKPYVLDEAFEVNKLTGDREMYEYMINQTVTHPEIGLGGPTLRWLNEALTECRALSKLPSPDMPCLTVLGTREDIVDPGRIHDRMAIWPLGHLNMIEGGNHEVLMEGPQMRDAVIDALTAFYNANSGPVTDPAPHVDAGGQAGQSATP